MTIVICAKLNSFELQPQIHKNYNGAYVQSMHCWRIHTFEEQNVYALQSSKFQVKPWFTETCPFAARCSAILSFQTGMDATLIAIWPWLLLSLKWCFSVGCNSHFLAFQCGAVFTFSVGKDKCLSHFISYPCQQLSSLNIKFRKVG